MKKKKEKEKEIRITIPFPESIYNGLKDMAESEERSLTGQLIYILKQELSRRKQ
jgi:hypothetical protein